MTTRDLACLVVLTAVASTAEAGPCAIPTIAPGPVFDGEQVAAGGGAIVALQIGFNGNTNDEKVAQPGWRFLDVNTRVVPVIDTIAPGLAVYRLPAAGGAELVLEDGAQKPLAKVRRALEKLPELAAPKLASIVYEERQVGAGYRSYRSAIATARLGAVPPAGAAMLVVYKVGAGGKVALAWASVGNGSDLTIYSDGGRCSRQIPGFTPPAAGDRIAVAWLDRSGRLSPLSNQVVARDATKDATKTRPPTP